MKSIIIDPRYLLPIIVLFGLVVRLAFFTGVTSSDDLAYSAYAYSIMNRGIPPESVLTLSTRLGLIYPTAVMYYLFGVNDLSSTIFVLLTGLGNIILAYFFGKLFHNEKTGLVAAFLVSIFPLEVVNSTMLLSDLPSAFFLNLGMYLFFSSEIRQGRSLNYFLSGLMIGIGYLIRESAALIAIFFAIYFIYNLLAGKRPSIRDYSLVAVGFLAAFSIELIALYKLTGDPFFRFTVVQHYLLETYIHFNYFNRLILPQGLFHYPYTLLNDTSISFFYIVGFFAFVHITNDKKLRNRFFPLLLWLVLLLLYLSFGSASFSHYLPFRAVPRYLSIITIPLVITLASFMAGNSFLRWKLGHSVATYLMLPLLVVSLFGSGMNSGNPAMKDLRQAYPYITGLQGYVYTDNRTIMMIDYLAGYRETGLVIYPYPDDLSSVQNAHIIINQQIMEALKRGDHSLQFQDELYKAPLNWELEKTLGDQATENRAILVYFAHHP